MRKVLIYCGGSFCAGILAGLIGIGGGMVLGPLMLMMGVNAEVSTATTATMIVLTSSSVAILFVSSGQVPIDYAATFFLAAFCGSVIGKLIIGRYVRKHKLQSLLIFILAGVIIFASIMITIVGVLQYHARDWCMDNFKPICVPK